MRHRQGESLDCTNDTFQRSFRKSGETLLSLSLSLYGGPVITVRRAVSRAAVSIIFLYGYCDRYHCLVDRILFEYGYDIPHRVQSRNIKPGPYALPRSSSGKDCIMSSVFLSKRSLPAAPSSVDSPLELALSRSSNRSPLSMKNLLGQRDVVKLIRFEIRFYAERESRGQEFGKIQHEKFIN